VRQLTWTWQCGHFCQSRAVCDGPTSGTPEPASGCHDPAYSPHKQNSRPTAPRWFHAEPFTAPQQHRRQLRRWCSLWPSDIFIVTSTVSNDNGIGAVRAMDGRRGTSGTAPGGHQQQHLTATRAAGDGRLPALPTGKVLQGTCGWTDASLASCGKFYPAACKTSEQRLAHYSRHFPCVEVSACECVPVLKHMTWASLAPSNQARCTKQNGSQQSVNTMDDFRVLPQNQGPILMSGFKLS
jgi:hypothetical protein